MDSIDNDWFNYDPHNVYGPASGYDKLWESAFPIIKKNYFRKLKIERIYGREETTFVKL